MDNTNIPIDSRIKTSLGDVVAHWDRQKIQGDIFDQLKRELAEAGNDRYDYARFEVASYLELVLSLCVQVAVEQAKRELITKGRVHATYGKHEKWELIKKAAEAAWGDSMDRLLWVCKVRPPKPGEHRKPKTEEWIHRFLKEQENKQNWEGRVIDTIKASLKRTPSTPPTMESVGKKLRESEASESRTDNELADSAFPKKGRPLKRVLSRGSAAKWLKRKLEKFYPQGSPLPAARSKGEAFYKLLLARAEDELRQEAQVDK